MADTDAEKKPESDSLAKIPDNISQKELQWLLEDQVQRDLNEIQTTLKECSRRFPYRMGFDDRTLVKPQRNLLSNPNNTGQIKCVVTLLGDSVCDADISFKHKSGKENHVFRTKISHEVQWKLQQVQDAANHLASTLSILSSHDPDHVYKTAKEVLMHSAKLTYAALQNHGEERLCVRMLMILEDAMKFLTLGRTCLSFPKKRSITELIENMSKQNFYPQMPNDVALSFYIHSSKLILALYNLHHTSYQVEIVSRHQVECTVQWLNEAVILFSLAIQQCQQLQDKLRAFQDIPNHKVS